MKEHNDSLDSPIKNMGSVPFTTSALRSTPGRYSDEEIPESPETSPDEEFGSRLKLNDYGYSAEYITCINIRGPGKTMRSRNVGYPSY